MGGTNVIRIVLISLFSSDKFHFIGESQGICSIAGYLESAYSGMVQIELFDQQIHSDDEIVNAIVRIRPHLIGYSIKMGTYPQFKELYSKIAIAYRDAIYEIAGNSFAHFHSHELLDSYPGLIISLGEGELAFGDLVHYLSGNKAFNDIRNIVYVCNGFFVKNKLDYLNADLIPIADRRNSRLFYSRGGEIYIEGSRGCGYCACSICECRYFLGSTDCRLKWRPKRIDKTIQELEILADYGIKEVTFADEDFFGGGVDDYKHVNELIYAIVEKGVDINYRINARVNSILHCINLKNDILSRLKKSGLVKIFLGFESGSASQLTRYSKGFFLNDFLKVIHCLDEEHIEYELGFIPFDPLMSFQELCETLRFVEYHHLITRVSSIIKELRIQGGNIEYLEKVRKYESETYENILGTYDYATQTYPVVKYADSKIDRIIHFLRAYEIETYADYYTLRIQTQYASHPDKQTIIRRLKLNDFNLLKDLVNGLDLQYSDKEIYRIIETFKIRRKSIYDGVCME